MTEVAVPYIKYVMRIKAEKRGDGSPDGHQNAVGKVQRTQAEKGLHLEQYDRKFSSYVQAPPTYVDEHRLRNAWILGHG